MFLQPNDTNVTERQLERLDLTFIIHTEEEYFLSRAAVLERQRTHPRRECVG
nr:MAG TPA: hypothetical protein [Caudoviricetes sp.]